MGIFAHKLANVVAAAMEAASQLSAAIESSQPPDAEETIPELDPEAALFLLNHAMTEAGAHQFAERIVISLYEWVRDRDDFAPFTGPVEEARERYLRDAEPFEPVTLSFFWTWAFYDLRFGPDRETFGGCVLETVRTLAIPEAAADVFRSLEQSRLGVLAHLGVKTRRAARLQDVLTGDEFLCLCQGGFRGRKGQLWLARTARLPQAENVRLLLTTPYVLTKTSAADWRAFLNKSLLERPADEPDGAAWLFKQGPRPHCWFDFVERAFVRSEGVAIYLAGLPDVPGAMPPPRRKLNAPVAGVPEQQLACKLTLSAPQRKALAELAPELEPWLALDSRGERVVELARGEWGELAKRAERAAAGQSRLRAAVLNRLADKLSKVASQRRVYKLLVELLGADPPVWRRIETPDCTLFELHGLIQDAMGWEHEHLWQFEHGRRCYIPPGYEATTDELGQDLMLAAESVQLSDLAPRGRGKLELRYVYDFGDAWSHRVRLESTREASLRERLPRCLEGEGACPPEDSGGIATYRWLVEALEDPDDPEHERAVELIGESFDPRAFDAREATRRMRRSG